MTTEIESLIPPTDASDTEQGIVQSDEQRRAQLLARAQILGLTFAKNIKTDALADLVLKASQPEIKQTSVAEEPTLSPREAARRKAMALRRVIIQPQDPHKTQFDFESITVGNGVIGTVTRVFPFNTEWHIEQCVYDTLKERMYQLFTAKNKGRHLGVPDSRWMPAYLITDLPALTKTELAQLAADQSARHSID